MKEDDKFVKLYSAANRLQAEMMVDILRQNKIRTYYKSEGAGQVMEISMGMSFAGNTIYVSEEDLHKAKTLLDEFCEESDVEDIQPVKPAGAGRIIALVWCILIVASILAAVIIYIVTG